MVSVVRGEFKRDIITAEVPLHPHTHGVVGVAELETGGVVVVEALDPAGYPGVILETPVSRCDQGGHEA